MVENSSFVLMGPPTSGKSSIALMLGESLGIPVFSGSGIARQYCDENRQDGSLVEDRKFIKGLEDALNKERPKNLILEGVPRTKRQAEFLVNWFSNRQFDLSVLDLQLPDEEVKSRIFDREICSDCEESYHFRLKPPKVFGKCDREGAFLIKRQNDDPVIVEKRLEKFHQEKEAILAVFRGAKSFVAQIDGTGTVKETYTSVLHALGIPSESSLPVYA